MTLNGVILRYFSEFGLASGALHKSSRSLSHLMSSCTLCMLLLMANSAFGLCRMPKFFSTALSAMLSYCALKLHIISWLCQNLSSLVLKMLVVLADTTKLGRQFRGKPDFCSDILHVIEFNGICDNEHKLHNINCFMQQNQQSAMWTGYQSTRCAKNRQLASENQKRCRYTLAHVVCNSDKRWLIFKVLSHSITAVSLK